MERMWRAKMGFRLTMKFRKQRTTTSEMNGIPPQEMRYCYFPHDRASEGQGEEVVDTTDRDTDRGSNVGVDVNHGSVGRGATSLRVIKW